MSRPSVIDTADGARAWMGANLGVSRGTFDQLDHYVVALRAENVRQNLISTSTLDDDSIWCRHILDSAQLLLLAGQGGGNWIDLGSGAGLPGLVIAILAPHWRVTLVEQRRLRCDFLRSYCADAGLGTCVKVQQLRVERLAESHYDVISARAFAPLDRLLSLARHLAGESTLWLLPKGKKAQVELSTLSPAWQTVFTVVPSLTNGESQILVGHGAMHVKRVERARKRG
ncbi:MAG: 16S rRNA (guanine(527)-N(7))-methyltransferase RsmG [Sphingopyxis sp.]